MKKAIYFFCVILFAASLFTASTAKAQDLPCHGDNPYTSCNTPGAGTQLPINGGVVYLLIAGTVVGVIALRRNRSAAMNA